MTDLKGKHVLLIGGMHDLTGELARVLQAAGAATSIAFDPQEGAKAIELISSRQVEPMRMRAMDFKSPMMLRSQITSFEPLDAVIWIPRWYDLGSFTQSKDSIWEAALSQNVAQAVFTLQAVAQLFIQQGRGGRIINLSFISAQLPLNDSSVLGTSLAALQALCRQAALELAEYNITVNTVAMGWLESDIYKDVLSSENKLYLEADIPLKRLGQADELAALCCFLISDVAAYMTGVTLPLDGGYTLQRSKHRSSNLPKLELAH